MDRGKNIIFISHCILNQNTVVHPLARAKGPYSDIIRIITDYGIGIHQLPCPEYRHLGLKRKPMSKEEYDTKEFRKLCKDIAEDTLSMMMEYLTNDYKIIGLIGINHSPTCSIRDSQGILMEELLGLAGENDLLLNLIDVPGEYVDGKDNGEFIKELKEFLE